jgi:hypothetical protein
VFKDLIALGSVGRISYRNDRKVKTMLAQIRTGTRVAPSPSTMSNIAGTALMETRSPHPRKKRIDGSQANSLAKVRVQT